MRNQPEHNGPIRFRNRHTGQIETEAVYGDNWLRWAYGNPLGKLTTRLAASRPWFSKWYGWRMSQKSSRAKIFPFIEQYGIDVAEMLRPPDHFEHFNAFFRRQLKPEARPIDPEPASVVFPADGRHLGFQEVGTEDHVFAKGQSWNIEKLLGDAKLADQFAGGSLVLSRLCPVDYHRFHFPAEGVPGAPKREPRLLDGPLYSVNPIALRQRLAIMWENKRAVTILHTEPFGDIAIIEIGATCVGSIVQTHVPGQHVEKGAEKGYFQFGGSSTITLFEKGRVTLAEDLVESTREGIELYAKMGELMGRA